jgi:DNA polymerase (family 10)
MINNKIADIFQEIGDILEIQSENPFRIRSYQRASQIVRSLATDLGEIYKKDPKKIREIKGIGEDLYKKIVEIIETGECEMHKDLLKKSHPGLLDMLRLRGLGPKKVKLIFLNLGIKDIKALEKAAKKGEIRDLPGMGAKTETEILKSIKDLRRFSERTLLPLALDEANLLIDYLKKNKHVNKIEYAGSLRRRKETIGDIDILVTTDAKNHTKETVNSIMNHFLDYPHVIDVLAHGNTKSSILLNTGVQVDLRVLEQKSFGAAMHYFTGSKAHNIAMRNLAKKKGLKLSEYGVFKVDKMIAGKTEDEVFKSVGLPYIIPEIRKNDGEIEAARKNKLPKSIELENIKGDLHMHTNWSDGRQTLEEVVEYSFKRGYEYIAITDHSKSSQIARGLTVERIKDQMKQIDELNKKYEKKNFKILKGSEVDILPDGSLDFPDEILNMLDIFPAAVHSRFSMTSNEMTNRIINAMKNKHVKIIAHPTGRLINKRNPYDVDIDAIIEAAAEYKVALELNAQPLRLDLTDRYLRRAKEKGAKITIGTDSHHTSQQKYMQYGIFMARRGWIEKDDVINTRKLSKLFDYWNKNAKK